MKKIIRNPLFTFVLGAIIFSSVVGVVAINYNAKDVSYTPSDNNWNVNNVEDALRDLRNINTTTGLVRIVKLGQYNTLNAQQINIKNMLPDNYKNLTLNNFVMLNAKETLSSGNHVDQENDVFSSYDKDTGILSINSSRYRASSYDFTITFTLGCILGNVNIEELNN